MITVVRCKYPGQQLYASGQSFRAYVTNYVSPQRFFVHRKDRKQVNIVKEILYIFLCWKFW